MNWYEDVAFPLHAALDDATDLPASTTVEDRWKLVMERCPWLTLRVISAGAPPAPAAEGDWHPLKSTNLDAMKVVAIGSNEAAADLIIRFKNGTAYRYTGVTYEDIAGLREAESPGGYFSTWIKNRYPAEKIA